MNNEERNNLLKKANIPENIWDKCYITDNKDIFTPLGDKTGEEVYEEWKSNINKKSEKKPSLEERVSEIENVILKLI